jgi:hypothetical protein
VEQVQIVQHWLELHWVFLHLPHMIKPTRREIRRILHELKPILLIVTQTLVSLLLVELLLVI